MTSHKDDRSSRIKKMCYYSYCTNTSCFFSKLKNNNKKLNIFFIRRPSILIITRCNSLNIETLELRRMRCDLLFTYKILFGLVDVVAADLFTLVNSGYNTRGYHINCRITIVASTVANISLLRELLNLGTAY